MILEEFMIIKINKDNMVTLYLNQYISYLKAVNYTESECNKTIRKYIVGKFGLEYYEENELYIKKKKQKIFISA